MARRSRGETWAGLALLSILCLLGCEGAPKATPGSGPAPRLTQSGTKAPVLDKGLVTRALAALEPKLPKDASFLEIRILPAVVELQLISSGSVTSLRYRETARPGKPQLANPLGTVDPPAQVPILGKGDLADNGFSAGEVDLPGIARAFPTALKAVDPADGRIVQVVVRRYLPFGTAVRARIFVESPRMPGSIDTNGKGIPLRSCY